jgi:hypothetical protein
MTGATGHREGGLPVPIVVGVPRSGTTLLRMMLDSHPQLAIPPETGFLPKLAALDPAADCAATALSIITSADTWPDFHLDPRALGDALAEVRPCPPALAARTFYRLYAARFGKPRWGDKTPNYGVDIDRIAGLLPEAHVVHLIRDGRDVAVSVRGMWFAPGDTIEALARDWADRIARTRDLGTRVAHYLEIRYESLVTTPERTLGTICDFLELTFDPLLLAYHRRASARLDEHEARVASDGHLIISKEQRRRNQRFTMEPPREDRIGRWRRELDRDEVTRFESVAGDWLDILGYPILSA